MGLVGGWLLKQFASNILIMNPPSLERARVINRIIMTNINHILDGVTPIFHEDLRAVDPTEKGTVSVGQSSMTDNSRKI